MASSSSSPPLPANESAPRPAQQRKRARSGRVQGLKVRLGRHIPSGKTTPAAAEFLAGVLDSLTSTVLSLAAQETRANENTGSRGPAGDASSEPGRSVEQESNGQPQLVITPQHIQAAMAREHSLAQLLATLTPAASATGSPQELEADGEEYGGIEGERKTEEDEEDEAFSSTVAMSASLTRPSSIRARASQSLGSATTNAVPRPHRIPPKAYLFQGIPGAGHEHAFEELRHMLARAQALPPEALVVHAHGGENEPVHCAAFEYCEAPFWPLASALGDEARFALLHMHAVASRAAQAQRLSLRARLLRQPVFSNATVLGAEAEAWHRVGRGVCSAPFAHEVARVSRSSSTGHWSIDDTDGPRVRPTAAQILVFHRPCDASWAAPGTRSSTSSGKNKKRRWTQSSLLVAGSAASVSPATFQEYQQLDTVHFEVVIRAMARPEHCVRVVPWRVAWGSLESEHVEETTRDFLLWLEERGARPTDRGDWPIVSSGKAPPADARVIASFGSMAEFDQAYGRLRETGTLQIAASEGHSSRARPTVLVRADLWPAKNESFCKVIFAHLSEMHSIAFVGATGSDAVHTWLYS